MILGLPYLVKFVSMDDYAVDSVRGIAHDPLCPSMNRPIRLTEILGSLSCKRATTGWPWRNRLSLRNEFRLFLRGGHASSSLANCLDAFEFMSKQNIQVSCM